MTNQDNRLFEGVAASPDEGESMDSLLQLTLPIVLILAYLLVTEVKALRETPIGQLRDKLDVAMLTLEHQLLLKATDEIARQEREDIGLADYKLATPGLEDVRDMRVDKFKRFISISTGLAERFNGLESKDKMRQRLHREVEARFETLVQEVVAQHRDLGEARHRKLQGISKENRHSYQTKLEGDLQTIEAEGVKVQLAVILAWLDDHQASQHVTMESRRSWRRIQSGGEDAEVSDQEAARFVNLKVDKLVEHFKNHGVELLDEAIGRARQ